MTPQPQPSASEIVRKLATSFGGLAPELIRALLQCADAFDQQMTKEKNDHGAELAAVGNDTGSSTTETASVIHLIDAAQKELSASVRRQCDERRPALKMTIPANPEADSDLVIGNALRAARKALASPATCATFLKRYQAKHDDDCARFVCGTCGYQRGDIRGLELIDNVLQHPHEWVPQTCSCGLDDVLHTPAPPSGDPQE